MNSLLSGLPETVATFTGNVAVGDIITIGNLGSVSKVIADKDLIGVCVSKRSTLVGILLRGAVELDYTGTAPVVGYNLLATSGSNAIKVSATGHSFLVLEVDTTAKKAVVLL